MIVARDARTLDEIADDIRSHWAATDDDRFAIGHCLVEARAQFPSDPEYGQWLREQNFPFTTRWGHTLRLAAENEPAVRELLGSQLPSGPKPNIQKAVKAVLHPPVDEPEREGVPRTKSRVTSKRVRNSPRWRGQFSHWCRHVLPEDRVYLIPMSRDFHKALDLLGLSCDTKESDAK